LTRSSQFGLRGKGQAASNSRSAAEPLTREVDAAASVQVSPDRDTDIADENGPFALLAVEAAQTK
jgi:hypothetical protein